MREVWAPFQSTLIASGVTFSIGLHSAGETNAKTLLAQSSLSSSKNHRAVKVKDETISESEGRKGGEILVCARSRPCDGTDHLSLPHHTPRCYSKMDHGFLVSVGIPETAMNPDSRSYGRTEYALLR